MCNIASIFFSLWFVDLAGKFWSVFGETFCVCYLTARSAYLLFQWVVLKRTQSRSHTYMHAYVHRKRKTKLRNKLSSTEKQFRGDATKYFLNYATREIKKQKWRGAKLRRRESVRLPSVANDARKRAFSLHSSVFLRENQRSSSTFFFLLPLVGLRVRVVSLASSLGKVGRVLRSESARSMASNNGTTEYI